MSPPLLSVEGLTAAYTAGGVRLRGVRDVDLTLDRGSVLGIVGESGSGKSTLSFAISRLLPSNARIEAGRVLLNGEDLLKLSDQDLRKVRGRRIAMVFQDPLSSLHPCLTVGRQMLDAQRAHARVSARSGPAASVAMLSHVGIPDAVERVDHYPHEFSGGMRQRIAMTLLNDPALLVADEPTSALDVAIQDQIVTLLTDLVSETGMALILVSHDLGMIASVSDEVLVMYAGEAAERSPAREIFAQPLHPYTQALLSVIPGRKARDRPLPTIPGRVPPGHQQLAGCAFAGRCPETRHVCLNRRPDFVAKGARRVRCHIHDPQSGWHRDTPVSAVEVAH